MKDYLVVILALALILWVPASWITHVIVCFGDDRWGFLIAGAIFFPVAMIHGTCIWLGIL